MGRLIAWKGYINEDKENRTELAPYIDIVNVYIIF